MLSFGSVTVIELTICSVRVCFSCTCAATAAVTVKSLPFMLDLRDEMQAEVLSIVSFSSISSSNFALPWS